MAELQYADVLTVDRLPIDAQDVVTRVRLVVLGTFGGSRDPDGILTQLITDPDPVTFDSVTLSHFPLPVLFEYEAPEHATYGCERAFQLPEGFNPFLSPDDELIPDPDALNMSDPENVRDGDPETYSEGTVNDGEAVLNYGTGGVGSLPGLRVAGYYLRYSLVVSSGQIEAGARNARMGFHQEITDGFDYDTRYRHELSAMSGITQLEQLYAYGMHDARGEFVNRGLPVEKFSYASVGVSGSGAEFTLRVAEFYPLVLNEELLEDVARAQIRVPASLPRRVSVRGIIPPDREHTIVGWPGGDLTASVAQQQYELGRTWVDFEQPGSPLGMAAEAIESARADLTLFRGEIQSAGYSVRMGDRR